MIVSDQLVTALATAAFPTFAVLIGILINNQRLNDFRQRFDDFGRTIDIRFNEVNRRIDDSKDILRAEMFRMEQVIDARLKHLEEHLQH
jgi:hypothetical protein